MEQSSISWEIFLDPWSKPISETRLFILSESCSDNSISMERTTIAGEKTDELQNYWDQFSYL